MANDSRFQTDIANRVSFAETANGTHARPDPTSGRLRPTFPLYPHKGRVAYGTWAGTAVTGRLRYVTGVHADAELELIVRPVFDGETVHGRP